jgi:hypothetical protein
MGPGVKGFVGQELRPYRVEKMNFIASSFLERIHYSYCLLKLSVLIFVTGAAEISFGQEGENRNEQRNSTRRRIERRRTSPANRTGW